MTQISRPQSDRRATYPDSGPYTAPEWAALLAAMMSGDVDNAGVRTDYLNWLAVTTAAGDILIDTGACFVDGHLLLNDASVTITPTAPGAPATYTVVAVQNNTNAVYATDIDTPAPYAAGIPAYSARLAVLRDTVLVQTANQWMIPLATFAIAVDGTISALTDARLFVPQVYTENIQNEAVTTAKIADDAVTTLKILDDAVTTAKILDGAVTEDKHNAASVEYGDYHPLLRQANDAIRAVTTGNARGVYAIDLQQVRAPGSPDFVASGPYSVIGGGEDNRSLGTHSTVAGGDLNRAGGDASSVGGGIANIANGDGAAITGGSTNTASGLASAVLGGVECAADGDYSAAGGRAATASGDYGHAGGFQSVASEHAQFARSGGRFAAQGDAQYSYYHLRRSVTHSDANWYTLYLDGAAVVINIPVDSVYVCGILLVGTSQGCAKSFGYQITSVIENDGGTTTMLASSVSTLYEDDADFDAQVVADNATDALWLQVQDATSGGDTVRWSAVLRVAQVTYPA